MIRYTHLPVNKLRSVGVTPACVKVILNDSGEELYIPLAITDVSLVDSQADEVEKSFRKEYKGHVPHVDIIHIQGFDNGPYQVIGIVASKEGVTWV